MTKTHNVCIINIKTESRNVLKIVKKTRTVKTRHKQTRL